jgi:AraC family transcriptional regulator, regulatory protein of adaptative response / methylated-DNA-[protein]-cysteine methyltransferase
LKEGIPMKGVSSGPVVAVRTTGIYCDTICRPGRAPKPENCVPFPDAESARSAGYRACKVCRPDDDRAESAETILYSTGETPVGMIFVAKSERGVCLIDMMDGDDLGKSLFRAERRFPSASLEADPTVARSVVPRLNAHIERGDDIVDVPLDLRGTGFQLKVWEGLRAIPRGTTLTYGELARSVGLDPNAARAVGSACGSNPVSLLVPCHRVLASGGRLGGYYWGLEMKRTLLEMEGVEVSQTSSKRGGLNAASRTAVP